MERAPETDRHPAHRPMRRGLPRRAITLACAVLAAYLAAAYFVVPLAWRRYARAHPLLEDISRVAHTRDGIPGDPLNVALIGADDEVKQIMLAAGWYPADPITLRSCLEIAEATILKRPYDHAPVSNLYLFGRKEDLAFEKPVGDNPRQRNHVRFWRSDRLDAHGRPVWVGSATYDVRVGLSRTTGGITHHISPEVDAERDLLLHDLEQTGSLAETYAIDDFHKVRQGANGGGDPWRTDGRMLVGVIGAP